MIEKTHETTTGGKRIRGLLLGCIGLPLLLVASCFAKVSYDAHEYDLPGPTLISTARATQDLDTPWKVAEALDGYVQPRFEILRDRDFGALRIVFRKHAGVNQLKVNTDREKAIIANVNAAGRDYAVGLLHCAPTPRYETATAQTTVTPKLGLLYINQEKVGSNWDRYYNTSQIKVAAESHRLDYEALTAESVKAVPGLLAGREHRSRVGSWEALMRPVLASKEECLDCHKTAKIGSTLGAMVYAVRMEKRQTARR